MAILSGSVILPVEALGAIQIGANSELSSSALAGAAASDADVQAGKKLNTDLAAFLPESSRVSVISALNALGGAISAGGVENITVDDFLSHDGSGGIEVVDAAFSASVGYVLDNNAAGVQQHITEDAYILELSSGEFTVNTSNLTSSIRGAVSAAGDLSYDSSSGAFSFTERTDAEVRGLVSAGGDLSYNSTTGVMSFTERTDAEVRGLISAGGDLSYNSSTGVMSFTERTDAEVRGLVSAGDGLSYNSSTGAFAASVDANYLEINVSGEIAVNPGKDMGWTAQQTFDAGLKLKDQDGSGDYYTLNIEDGLLKVVLVP